MKVLFFYKHVPDSPSNVVRTLGLTRSGTLEFPSPRPLTLSNSSNPAHKPA